MGFGRDVDPVSIRCNELFSHDRIFARVFEGYLMSEVSVLEYRVGKKGMYPQWMLQTVEGPLEIDLRRSALRVF